MFIFKSSHEAVCTTLNKREQYSWVSIPPANKKLPVKQCKVKLAPSAVAF